MRDATRIVRAGAPPASQGAPFLPGPTFASVFHLAGDPASAPFQYGRFHNPTWSAFEAALTELEGGPALVFPSGMAATYAVMATLVAPGGRLVMTGDAYYTARGVAQRHLVPRGIEVVQAADAVALRAAIPGAQVVWVETPSNPLLEIYDIRALSAAARQAGALLVVDNTTPTVGGQVALALGADVSLASDTKALCGHSDVVLGHVAVRDPAHAERLRVWRTETGAIAGPMEVWLAHRSLGSLDVRLERMCANALGVATWLQARPDVLQTLYPGLPNHPGHDVARAQMQRFGPVVSFELRSAAAAHAFLESSALIHEATSFGGLHTSGERRARWGGDPVGPGFIRLSLGCEHLDDLLEDLAQALERAAAAD